MDRAIRDGSRKDFDRMNSAMAADHSAAGKRKICYEQ